MEIGNIVDPRLERGSQKYIDRLRTRPGSLEALQAAADLACLLYQTNRPIPVEIMKAVVYAAWSLVQVVRANQSVDPPKTAAPAPGEGGGAV